jgi:iron uptake system EfeUOB component EfeO/EfeM
MKKIYVFSFALMVLLTMAMSAEALEYKTISRSNGVAADASWTETDDDVTTNTYLSVTGTNDGTDIYLYIDTYDMMTGTWSGKSGSIYTQDDVFSMDKKLNSASLSDVQIEVYSWYVDETGEYIYETEPVTVSADWTGTGDITKSSYTSMSRDGDYVWRSSSSSSHRSAIATGSINGNDLGSSNSATLIKFKQAYMDMKK